MDRARVVRLLRIAASTVCLTACVLLIALWVRSYTWCDVVGVPLTKSNGLHIASKSGDLGCRISAAKAGWSIHSIEMAEILSRTGVNPSGFYWSWRLGPWVQIRYWFLLMIVATLAIAPWLRWRFSLRTLLIAMTLVAVVLGLIVALAT